MLSITTPVLVLSTLFPLAPFASAFDCNHIRVDGISFDLSRLGGPHSLSHIENTPPSVTNTSFTFDICKPLPKDPRVPDSEQCVGGTRFCAVERDTEAVADEVKSVVHRVVSIAGDFQTKTGRTLDAKVSRLKGSGSHLDAEREGIRVEFHGGRYPDEKSGRDQSAVVEFECDQSRTGDEESKQQRERKRAEDGDGGEGGKGKEGEGEEGGKSLQFISYKIEEEEEVLRLSWKTKYACESVDLTDDDAVSGSKGWGFFGWLFIV